MSNSSNVIGWRPAPKSTVAPELRFAQFATTDAAIAAVANLDRESPTPPEVVLAAVAAETYAPVAPAEKPGGLLGFLSRTGAGENPSES